MIYFSHSVVGYLCNCTNCDQGGHPERPHIRSHTATGYWFTTCREQIFLEINIIITNIVITKDLAVALTCCLCSIRLVELFEGSFHSKYIIKNK